MWKLLIGFLLALGMSAASAMPRELFMQVKGLQYDAATFEYWDGPAGAGTWLRKACEQSPRLDSLILTEVADEQGNLYTSVLDLIIQRYSQCFSNIFIGTTTAKWTGPGSVYSEGMVNADYRWKNIYLSRTIADNLLARYPNLYFNWYISYEANLNYFIGDDVRVDRAVGTPISGYTVKEAYKAFLYQLSSDLYAKRPRAVLWSPSFWTAFNELSITQQSQLQLAVRDVMLFATRVNWVHFQDFMGQSAIVQCRDANYCFPRIVYKSTCENTVKYFNLLKAASTNTSVVSLRTNLEMFVTQRFPSGSDGFVPADRNELNEREACYARNNVPIGASWEIRYWYRSYFEVPRSPW
jgi:hypothetical protein